MTEFEKTLKQAKKDQKRFYKKHPLRRIMTWLGMSNMFSGASKYVINQYNLRRRKTVAA